MDFNRIWNRINIQIVVIIFIHIRGRESENCAGCIGLAIMCEKAGRMMPPKTTNKNKQFECANEIRQHLR